MFNDRNKIKDDRDYFNNGNSLTLKPVVMIFGVIAVASMMMKDANLYDMKNYIKDLVNGHLVDDDITVFLPENKNEMFCPIPGKQIENLKSYFDDPLRDFMKNYQNDFKFFWEPSKEPKTLSFEFMKEATQTNDKEQWFETIPKHVIDDPSIQFILSGHASYDLDEKYNIGLGATRLPDNFTAIEERHREVNTRYVDGRLNSVKTKLMAMGISEDRIITRNYGHRYDRRAVDVEVCLPDQIPPEPES